MKFREGALVKKSWRVELGSNIQALSLEKSHADE